MIKAKSMYSINTMNFVCAWDSLVGKETMSRLRRAVTATWGTRIDARHSYALNVLLFSSTTGWWYKFTRRTSWGVVWRWLGNCVWWWIYWCVSESSLQHARIRVGSYLTYILLRYSWHRMACSYSVNIHRNIRLDALLKGIIIIIIIQRQLVRRRNMAWVTTRAPNIEKVPDAPNKTPLYSFANSQDL